MSGVIFHIDPVSPVPRYQQIVRTVQEGVASGQLRFNQPLPSLNELCAQLGLSRQTALSAYQELKSRGIIAASPGKGYYVASEEHKPQHKVFLLFDELNGFKQVLYQSFKDALGEQGQVDIFFHHCNPKVFRTLVYDNLGSYTNYVIMPLADMRTHELVGSLPADKLVILDVGREQYGQQFASVCQHFEQDVYEGLLAGLDRIRHYRRLVLVFPDVVWNPTEIVTGFERFCRTHGVAYDVVKFLAARDIKKGEAYLVIEDTDLVHVVRAARQADLLLGRDLGVIAFNDAPLKEVVAEGITTISTDFAAMGRAAAGLVLGRQRQHLDNPSTLIKRASL
ncbi:GntR family transcriptional regulator [Hymenobacter sp.]|uniref:GntR family transcriptional regulator n=1 Tax=Hymenobacter sp. TaxID=1898978 RepID=UPI00286C5A8F|nr:GntR family transcriptional regulator [Hymenobacter sp.]